MPDPSNAIAKPSTNLTLCYDDVQLEHHDAPFSNISFASLIFVARYGLPPRSGWLRSIICRCFLRSMSFVTPRSLSSRHSSVLQPRSS